jgi:formylmethanofuran dehydrogenase subunit E
MPIKSKKKYNEYMRNYYKQQKQDKIIKKGGKCYKCGESQIEFLNLRKGKVICWNCQFAKK